MHPLRPISHRDGLIFVQHHVYHGRWACVVWRDAKTLFLLVQLWQRLRWPLPYTPILRLVIWKCGRGHSWPVPIVSPG